MILWNLASLILIVLIIVEARNNEWQRPELASWATIGALWFVGSGLLWWIS